MGVQGSKKGVRVINEIRKYKERGLNKSQIARALNISRNTVKKYLNQIESTKEKGSNKPYEAPWSDKVDWKHVLRERDFSYISFWREFRRRYPNIKLDIHQTFIPGERCEFDYKGRDQGFGYIDRETGEFIQCRLFGMILPASQLFYPRATLTEKQEDVFDSIARGFKKFGGVTSTIVFDNAKAQVTKADNFDPEINSEFSLFCDNYNIAPMAARPRKPKDKSLIENTLGIFWRWAWPQIRKKEFFSLQEINAELTLLAEDFNNRIQKKYGLSRRQKFESFEKEKLKTLPAQAYESGVWKKVKVHPDCHIQVSYNFFSVPYKYRGQELNVRISKQCLEVYSGLERVAIHRVPLNNRGRYFTNSEHLPEAHKAILERTPQSILKEASAIGNNTGKVARRLIEEARHPLTYLRRIQGILRFKKRYSSTALEEACAFFADIPLQDIKMKNIEQVINAQVKKTKSKKVTRQPNENLRGQLHWAETFH